MTYTRPFTHKLRVSVPMPDLADFITTEEAARLLGFNVKSVRDLVYKGKLKSSHFGRSLLIPRDSVKDYIKKTTGMSKNDPRRGK